jgi:pSer/pThr/pTyr-binding forkhead associated (FHA) protein
LIARCARRPPTTPSAAAARINAAARPKNRTQQFREDFPCPAAISALETSELHRFPAMPRVTITVPGKKPQPYRFQLDRQTVRLGRGSDNDIVIDCASVSVRHAEMERVPGGYRLRDLGSTNGTKLDDQPKEVIELKNGVAVKLGDVEFDFQLNEEELKALAEEAPAVPSPVLREEDDEDGQTAKEKKQDEAAEGEDAATRTSKRSKESHPKRHHHPPAAEPPSATASFFTTLLLFALAIAAFIAGLALRHNKETGRSLLEELLSRKPPAETVVPATSPENPAPAGQE